MPTRALLFSRTTGYRHASIPAAVRAVSELLTAQGWTVTATEDTAELTERLAAGVDLAAFLSTSGEVLDAAGRQALRAHCEAGGGFAGVHAATTTEYDWPWYGRLVGARFDGHPPIQTAVVEIADPVHPAVSHLPRRWQWSDEWYNFRDGPADDVRVLATVDESTYRGGTMGARHPLVWCHEHCGGRSFQTALGHAAEHYADPEFRRHLLGGLAWAARREADAPVRR
ncbi:ThuA domain-containing protein [Streptomyces bohaiensis]|uniref:ThuA domain-containing protein n=1 Tax=Streptomyces bohaiensis TaxID=1431344 RepID=UPI003B7F80A8